MINTIILGHALNVLPKLPAESVNCVVTSPPFWNLRDYGVDPVIWDGDKNCKHEFNEYNSKLLHENRQNLNGGTLGNPQYRKNLHGFGSAKAGFYAKCGAWKGSLGLEPTFELYIEHLCQIFDEVKRALRKDGTCWVNMGDSYGGSQGKNAGWPDSKTRAKVPQQLKPKQYAKCLLDIPYRFSIEMTNWGWIKRNTIIWWKPNCMPSSADNRFTIDFEYLFFFVKNNKTLFWTNENTLECIDKKPLGIKGIEDEDWEWRKCPRCQGKGEIIGKTLKEGASPINTGSRVIDENTKTFRICTHCKGSGKVKYSFWTGHDYWFEQQFDEHTTKDDLDRRKNKYWSGNIADGGSGKQNKGRDRREFYGKQGRNKRCVWIIPTQPFPEAHFAVYPEGLIEIPIKAGCPEFICKKCGKARVKIYEPTEEYKKYLRQGNLEEHHAGQETKTKFKVKANAEYKFKGYSDCGCNAGWESGINLDPFMGAGTSALVALKQRKRFIGIEIKQEYVDMSYRKIAEVQQEIF